MVLRLSLKTSKPPWFSSDSHFIHQIHTGGPYVFPSDVVIYVACHALCLFVILAVSHFGVWRQDFSWFWLHQLLNVASLSLFVWMLYMLQKKKKNPDSYCIFWLKSKRQDACVECFLNVLYVTLCAPCTFTVLLKCPITDWQSLHAYLFQICI